MIISKKWSWLVLFFFLLFPGQALAQNNAGIKDHKGHWAEKSIQEFVDMDITRGYPDGTFRPNAMITRAEFLTLLVKAFDLPTGSAELPFPDVKANDWFRAEAVAAKEAGIVQGDERGNFEPQRPVNRAEMVTMVIRAAGESLVPSGQKRYFPDVSRGSWMEEPIALAVQAEIVSGYVDGLFHPQRQATRAEAATLLTKALQSLQNPEYLPNDEKLMQVVIDFENAGIEETNRQSYSLTASLGYTIGLAREMTIYQSEQLKKETELSQVRLTIEPVAQEARVFEKSRFTAKVRYKYHYKVRLQTNDLEQSGIIAETIDYSLRKQNGQWKIYKMEEAK
ncbi:S-layer homology domain-containing protein [Heliorestis acidaminivorans]|uniref:S-layer homology domain-containing protein n=1 Tax=Heliorestis acidaminivorans TaxID=553427 RepID=A0A6I0ENM1_9FIRM|nr:S-layer homology domain-containing protein [Heliorestis acidaminivorans]KAB2951377.1 S-layer homology domain-containing protein [Heliorestis acidaminivorans]